MAVQLRHGSLGILAIVPPDRQSRHLYRSTWRENTDAAKLRVGGKSRHVVDQTEGDTRSLEQAGNSLCITIGKGSTNFPVQNAPISHSLHVTAETGVVCHSLQAQRTAKRTPFSLVLHGQDDAALPRYRELSVRSD